jgi:Dihaem cytochrome c
MDGSVLAALTAMKRAVMFALLIACPVAVAAEDVWIPRETNAAWQDECGCCHMAFPPALLSKGDWQRPMQGLDTHFGVNASMDPKMRDEIGAFLERNAASSWGHSADSMRITETDWFVRKHQGPIRMMMKGRVQNLVDCAACHKGPGTGFAD